MKDFASYIDRPTEPRISLIHVLIGNTGRTAFATFVKILFSVSNEGASLPWLFNNDILEIAVHAIPRSVARTILATRKCSK